MPNDLPNSIRIATRASQLAQWQARHVAALLAAAAPDVRVDLVPVTTTGDRVQSEPLRAFGGVGVFTREVQQAVLDGRADVAVHSLKDLPTESTPGLVLAAVPPREVRFDALVLPKSAQKAVLELKSLPTGARIGTGSLRRQAQLRHLRDDWTIAEVRGNVDTRLRKLDAGEYDALILAAAGLIRLGLSQRITARLEPPLMYPAVGQGAIGIECRVEDVGVRSALSRLTDAAAWTEVQAERSLLAALRAGCHAPLGVVAQRQGERLSLEAVVLSPDGRRTWSCRRERLAAEAEELGKDAAQHLVAQGAGAALQPK
jgi:hydroxymethylbilane synthase